MSYDLEGVRNDADSHELLSVVAAVHHEGVGQTLDDGAVRLAESLGGISTSGVRDVDGGSDLDVIAVKFPPLACRASSNGSSYVATIGSSEFEVQIESRREIIG